MTSMLICQRLVDVHIVRSTYCVHQFISFVLHASSIYKSSSPNLDTFMGALMNQPHSAVYNSTPAPSSELPVSHSAVTKRGR